MMEHIFTLTSIIDHARKNDLPLTITFIDFKNAFGSIFHSFVKDIMFHMKVHHQEQYHQVHHQPL